MLLKMYLVSADQYHKNVRHLPPPTPSAVHKLAITSKSRIIEGRRKPTRSRKSEDYRPYEKWVKFREKMRQENIGSRTRVKAVADLLKHISPPPPLPRVPKRLKVSRDGERRGKKRRRRLSPRSPQLLKPYTRPLKEDPFATMTMTVMSMKMMMMIMMELS